MVNSEWLRRCEPESLSRLLDSCDEATFQQLRQKAVETSVERWGKGIYIRGLIEISSYCHNNCYYCGLRRDNKAASRYRLDIPTILGCCRAGYDKGIRTFVLQAGEDPLHSDEWLETLVGEIHSCFPDVAITLSLGERSADSYKRLKLAGATRYLLRHEAAQKSLYEQIHPKEMTLDNRLMCIKTLRAIGYQTGMGMMIGVPGQTTRSIVEDLMLMKEINPQMIGIGPFIPHRDTPMRDSEPGTERLTLLVLAVTRLMFPDALIPATTALATLKSDGHLQGILSGANVIMPNLSPHDVRTKYSIYDKKAVTGSQSADQLSLLSDQLRTIGYHIDYSRGDYREFL